MHHDIGELQRFYYSRTLGRVVQRILRDKLVRRWQPAQCKSMTVAGYGFAAPMLRPYLATARRVSALMPGPQGVMPWPAGQKNHSVLCDEDAWPIETGSVDRLVVLHGLETSDNSDALLAEIGRVMGPGGKAMIMVPNRAGLWAATDRTPFGFGRSYTAGQLEAQLLRAGLKPHWHGSAVYIPPSDRRFWLRTAQMWERTGNKISRILIAGVVMVEVSKQTRAPIDRGTRSETSKSRELLDELGLARPRPKPGQAARREPANGSES